MARTILPGSPLRLKASEATKAIRAGELFDQLWTRSGVSIGGNALPAITLPIANVNDIAIPAFGMVRWGGAAAQPATVGGAVPELILRTKTNVEDREPIGIVRDEIVTTSAGSSLPVQIGRIQIAGVAWARVLGPIFYFDRLAPNADYIGIKTNSPSNIEALSQVIGSVEAIIPVRIMNSLSCTKRYKLIIEGNPDGGSMSVIARDGSGTTVGTITVAWNAAAAAVEGALETATGLSWSVGGGPFPNNPMEIIPPPDHSVAVNTASLDQNGPVIPYGRTDVCCY